MLIGLGIVGAVADIITARQRSSRTLGRLIKGCGQLIVVVVFGVLSLTLTDAHGVAPASLDVSLLRDLPAGFAGLGVVAGVVAATAWICVLVGGMANAATTVEDFDGLAVGALIFSIGAFVLIGFWQTVQSCTNPALRSLLAHKCYPVTDPAGLTEMAVVLVSALVGFLWWNTYPTRVRLGETGTTALGGALAGLAIFARTELLLVLVGGLFLFLAATRMVPGIGRHGSAAGPRGPLHRNLESAGWARMTVIVRFWISAGLAGATGFGIFYADWVVR
ncbi:phospho-N-acetylmuramoyl-pentapeptide-transferase [Arthrobacter sp. A5]|uniref:phospho-N-acetylmuramoyl-pentapeptide- transferase n=1 Tax=Arthrobacter sp. A5 TaxID=576926 RepID=UPI003DA90546